MSKSLFIALVFHGVLLLTCWWHTSGSPHELTEQVQCKDPVPNLGVPGELVQPVQHVRIQRIRKEWQESTHHLECARTLKKNTQFSNQAIQHTAKLFFDTKNFVTCFPFNAHLSIILGADIISGTDSFCRYLLQPFYSCTPLYPESWYKYAESALLERCGPVRPCCGSHDPQRRGRAWNTGRGKRGGGWRSPLSPPLRTSAEREVADETPIGGCHMTDVTTPTNR